MCVGGITMFGKASLISIALVAMLPTVTHAHDIYTNLTNRSGKSCCDGSDCRPAPFRIGSSGAVEMLIDQQWLEIPSESIEYRSLDGDTGETNGAHWCGSEIADPHIAMLYTYCAFLPPNLSSLQSIRPDPLVK